jgi:phosphoglucomutase
MSEIQILTQMRDSLVTFFDELIELMPLEGDIVVIRFFIADKIPMIDIMEHIVENILPLFDLVKAKDERFFLENNILFDALDGNKVNYFKNLWVSGTIDKEDKDVIWKWFSTILIMAQRYSKITLK